MPLSPDNVAGDHRMQMGDRVYYSGAQHPELAGTGGVVLRAQGPNVVVQMDDGQRIVADHGELQKKAKVAMHGDEAIIAEVADEVFDGNEMHDDPLEPMESVMPDAGRAIYHGEDRDVAAPDGQSPKTTASVKTACSCGCDKGEGGECKCGPECDCPECGKLKKSAKKKCECWDGYKRVPGTKPCAPGSCEKCDSSRKNASLFSNIGENHERV